VIFSGISKRAANLGGFGVEGFDRFDGTDGSSAPGPASAQGWWTWAGVPVDERRALQHITWWSCVSLLADSITQLPIGCFRTVDDARVPLALPTLFVTPDADVGFREWIHQLVVSVVARGNCYGLVLDRDGHGTPTQIKALHPDEVITTLSYGTPRYNVFGISGGLDRRDMLHIKGLTLPGRYSFLGLDPVAYARHTIGRGLAAAEYASRFFGQSANPGGLLSTDQDMPDATAKEMQDRWMEAHGHRQRKPAVLSGGLKWQSVEIKPEESQFLETIKATRLEIAGFFRVPPHLIGLGDMQSNWGTGVEENALQYVTFTLQPWLTRIEDALSALLPKPQYVKFNTTGFLRSRTLDRYRGFLMAREGGWINPDEIRALEDMPPIPDGRGQDYLQPLNYTPVPAGGAGAARLAADAPALTDQQNAGG
jgi:HK97 family phage portal protein